MTAPLRRLLITLAAVALIALRKSDSLRHPQFWAEDGGIFFIYAELHSWGDVFKPYEGYLHFLPRVIASLGTYLPALLAPTLYAWSALLITGVVAWRLQSPRLHLPGATVAVLALAVVPHNGEIFLTIANLQWITAIALLTLAITDDPATKPALVGDFAVLVVAGLTGPFILLSLPLFAWRASQQKSRTSFALLAVAIACASAHLPSLLHRPPPEIIQPWAPLHYAAIVGRRLIATLFVGELAVGEIFCRALTFVSAVVLAALLWRRRRNLPGAGAMLYALVAVLLATAYKARIDTWKLSELFNADRYFYISKILLIWLLAALAARGGLSLRVAISLSLASVMIANAPRFFYPPLPDQHWQENSARIERGERIYVPILPAGLGFEHPGRHR